MRRVGTLGLVAALAAILVSPLPAHAEDASGAVTYNAGNGYSFEKLSHPTVGTSQPDGIVDYQGNGAVAVPGADGNTANNEGDRGQSYTWAAASYGDWLYVGTCYAAMGNTLTLMNSTLGDSFDVETMRLTLEAMFNGPSSMDSRRRTARPTRTAAASWSRSIPRPVRPSCYSLNRSTASLLCSAMP